MQIRFDVDTRDVKVMLGRVKKQIPYATRVAINNTAVEVQKAIKGELAAKVDRPTRFTMNSPVVQFATKARPAAAIAIRDEAFKGVAPINYLAANIHGGESQLKRSERLLMARGVMKPGQRLIPGRRAKLDRYGNLPRNQINKALSNIGHQADRWQNTRQNTRRKKGKARFDYFLIPNGHPNLTPGIWKEERGWAYPWAIFADRASRRRGVIRFDAVAQATATRVWPRKVRAAVARALATAR
ncbi:hypothetical protein KUW19_00170 [Ferrimonas balearica]|uniref:hypothetical protein n=1 Tax=Ferrimonas balearica TaxID=44012 RepID=UPI001C97AA3D|nr:hypothetical protein [Ferrimonas balearica]MBY6104896.1 hypothetical protein [Ferrimonas balearica]